MFTLWMRRLWDRESEIFPSLFSVWDCLVKMEFAKKDSKRRSFPNRFLKKNRYTKEESYIKAAEKHSQRPHGVTKCNKVQDVTRLQQRKLSKLLDKRRKREQEREIQRRNHSIEKPLHFQTCQALNRFERQCKSKVLDESDFCKIHQFCDGSGASGMVQCQGRNKRLKRCIKSVLPDEKYCSYHKNQNKLVE